MKSERWKYLDEAAFAGSGIGLSVAVSNINYARKKLYKEYARTAFDVAGKDFSKVKYNRWLNKHLAGVRKYRFSSSAASRTKGWIKDFQYMNPNRLTRSSQAILKTPRKMGIAKAVNRGKFWKIAPKSFGKAALAIGFAGTLPAIAFRIQKDKRSAYKALKEDSIRLAGIPLGAFALYTYANRKKIIKAAL